MGTLWRRSNSIEWDANGDRASGAKVYFYDAGTSTPRAAYQNADLSTAHPHPVVADGNGRWPAIFLQFGDYKETATTSGGSELWSTDNITNDEPFDDTFELDEDALYNTGDFILSLKNGSRAGAVRCNGKTIGSAASGGTERANADAEDLFAFIWNNVANGQAAVSTGRGASAAADFAANKTIVLPDFRNATVIGFGDMGSTDAGLAAGAPIVSGSPILAGSIIGANTHALITAELASHTHTGTTGAGSAHTHAGTTALAGTHSHTGTSDSGGAHSHTVSGGTVGGAATISSVALSGGGATSLPITVSNVVVDAAAAHTHTFTTATGGTHDHTFTTGSEAAHTHTFTSAATGSGTAHNNLSRAIPVTVLMKL